MALAKGSCNKNSNFFRFHRLAVGFRRFRSFHRSAVCSLSYLLLSYACYAGQFVIQVPKTVQSGSQARLVIEPKWKPKISKRNEMEEVFPWLTMDSQLVFYEFFVKYNCDDVMKIKDDLFSCLGADLGGGCRGCAPPLR